MPATATPAEVDRVLAQRRAALQRADAVRLSNANTIREIKAMPYREGMAVVADILRHADLSGPIGTLPIERLVKAVRSIHDARAEVLLCRAELMRFRWPVRRISMRQRHLLAEALDDAIAEARVNSRR